MNITLDSIIDNKLTICQPENGFRFSSDSIYLANFLDGEAELKLIDIGSGSGVIAALLAKIRGFKDIDAVEYQDKMFQCLLKTVAKSELQTIVTPHHCDIKMFKPDKRYDLVVSNPPYKRLGSGRLPSDETDLNARFSKSMSGLDVFRFASSWLKNNGSVYMSYDAESVADLFEWGFQQGFEAKRMKLIYNDLKAKPKIVLAEFRRGGGRELTFEPPHFININGVKSDEEIRIMNGDWD